MSTVGVYMQSFFAVQMTSGKLALLSNFQTKIRARLHAGGRGGGGGGGGGGVGGGGKPGR